MTNHCVFCPDNWDNLDVVLRTSIWAIINPLNPVTEGHVLVIHRTHTNNAAEDPDIASTLMLAAAVYCQANPPGQANIITSIGPDATQTVMHTHVHIVPRRPGDGLKLP